MKHEIDHLLKDALSYKEEPDDRLNQRIIKTVQQKERAHMDKNSNRIRVPAAALLAALVIFAGSATVYAAWKYLTPDQVAEVAEDLKLAEAFRGEDAVAVNEVQECGKYRITLLGIVSGKNLSQYISTDYAGNLQDNRTYVVTAIENADGTKRPDTSDDDYGKDPFLVSPLIQGLNPKDYNIITMNGSYFEMVEDGIQYRIAECDNVEMFADREIYLCVSDGNFYNIEAYQYDENSGVISRNESYQGVNALFTLPFDQEKADKQAAEEYLKTLQSELSGQEAKEEESISEESLCNKVSKEVSEWKLADFNEKTKLITEIEIAPNAKGAFEYDYTIGENGMGSSGTIMPEFISERDEEGLAKVRSVRSGDDEDTAYIETYTLQDNGRLILRTYQYTER
ncbi:MAG: hypothetical protein HFI71_05870 [Lachnospiraceae bacterium]|nr:hypothetical protein [Lachnospiraceae bacterium]